MFAKLYGKKQQVLVMINEGKEGPEVRIFSELDGFGVCSTALGFSDDDLGWQKAEKAFEQMDEATARSILEKTLGQFVKSAV